MNLYNLAIGTSVFTNTMSLKDTQWKLSRYFNIKNFKYLCINPELKTEYCCFFHFLLGKRRSMSKRDDIEVLSLEKHSKAESYLSRNPSISWIHLQRYEKLFRWEPWQLSMLLNSIRGWRTFDTWTNDKSLFSFKLRLQFISQGEYKIPVLPIQGFHFGR